VALKELAKWVYLFSSVFTQYRRSEGVEHPKPGLPTTRLVNNPLSRSLVKFLTSSAGCDR
jgi:hypothetical protein